MHSNRNRLSFGHRKNKRVFHFSFVVSTGPSEERIDNLEWHLIIAICWIENDKYRKWNKPFGYIITRKTWLFKCSIQTRSMPMQTKGFWNKDIFQKKYARIERSTPKFKLKFHQNHTPVVLVKDDDPHIYRDYRIFRNSTLKVFLWWKRQCGFFLFTQFLLIWHARLRFKKFKLSHYMHQKCGHNLHSKTKLKRWNRDVIAPALLNSELVSLCSFCICLLRMQTTIYMTKNQQTTKVATKKKCNNIETPFRKICINGWNYRQYN